MKAIPKTFRGLSALALAATLAACGGGGGGGGDDTNPPADVVSSGGTLNTDAGGSSYGSGSLELSAFEAINQARGSAGAGLVLQSAALDTAAAAHATYLTTNIASGVTHDENPSLDDYYEATPTSRAARAGFSVGYITEVIGGTGASMLGSDCVKGLLNTVYHAAAILSPVTNVGVGFGTDAGGTPMCVAKLATRQNETYVQVPPAGELVSYPYGGQANVPETFHIANEVPRPPVSLFPNATAGTPVIVSMRNTDFVNFQAAGNLAATVTTFVLRDAGGNAVPAGILANPGLTGSGVSLTQDANLGEGFLVLVPQSPLVNGATYTVTFAATLGAGGSPLTKTWSFTTNP